VKIARKTRQRPELHELNTIGAACKVCNRVFPTPTPLISRTMEKVFLGIERFASRAAATLVPDQVELGVVATLFAAVSLVVIPFWAASVAHKNRRLLVATLCVIINAFTAVAAMFLCISIGMDPRTKAGLFRHFVWHLISSVLATSLFGAGLACFLVCGFGLVLAIPWLIERPMRIAKLYAALLALFLAYMSRNATFE